MKLNVNTIALTLQALIHALAMRDIVETKPVGARTSKRTMNDTLKILVHVVQYLT